MAEKSMPDKMAVSSDNQVGNTPRKDSFSRDEVDLKNPMGAQRPLLDGLPKKKSTFKITSITMNAPRGASSDLTYEADGDSLEDLDESHTEEVSSEILDNSRNTDVELDPASEDTTHNLTPDDTGGKDKVVDVQSRFKVVKIETHEPFRRGRWLCHDFLDLAQAAVEKTEIRAGQQEESHSGNSSAGSSIHYIHGADDPLKNPLAGALPQPQGNQNAQLTNNVHIGHIPSDQTLPGAVQNAVHGSMNIQQNNNDFQPINPAQSNSQSAQISGGVQNTRGETPVPQLSGHGQVLGQVTSQSVLHQSQPQMPQSTVSQQVPSQVGQGIPQGLSQQASVLQQQQQQQQLQQTHAQQQSQQIHHNLVQSQLSNSAMSHSQSVGGMQSAHPQSGAHPQVPQHQTPHSQPPINPMQPPVLHTSQGIPRDVNAGGLPASHLPTNIPDHLKNSVNQTGGAAVHIHNKVHVHQSLLGHDTGNINVRKVSAPSNLQSVPASDASAMPMDKLPHHGGTSSVAAPEGLHIPKGMSGGHTNHMDANKREFLRLDHIGGDDNVHVEASAPSGDMTERSEVTTPLLTPLAAAVGGLSSPTKDGREENQSGSNTLAIDNKIGEAMDLVKSHLMLTVRAEVAVLKEQIKELKEKNSKLEYENSILKASASPETLTKLSQP